MADGDLVRKITISATGENIDSTTASVKALGDATSKTGAANDNAKASAASAGSTWVDYAAKLYLAKSAYDAVTSASDSTSASLGRLNNAVINGAKSNELTGLADKFNSVWQEGIDKLSAYVALSMAAGNLSVEYYQRLTKGATDAKKPADEYLKVIQNINTALDRTLGTNGNQNGSTFNTQVLDLQKNGNLQGQTADVNRLNNSVTGQEQINAAMALIKGATDAGEKLVAFKLAGTLMGPEAAANLKLDNDYIYQIEQSIKNVQDKDIVKQADVDHAVAMKTAMEDSQKTIDKIVDSWLTVAKTDWSNVGIGIQQLWLNANQNFAATLSWLDKILSRTQEIADVKPTNPENSIWTKIGDYFTNNGQNMPDGSQRMSDADRQYEVAKQNLGSQLGNSNNVKNARQAAQKADDFLTPDQSSPAPLIAATKAQQDNTDAVDRAINSLTRHIETQKADVLAIGLGDGALAGFRVTASETAAVLANGGKETDAQRESFARLKVEATSTAEALAKAKVASEISRGRQTAFLGPEDIAIANQLKGIYGDNIPAALNSSEAAALRMNNVLKSINDTARSAVTSFGTDLVHGLEAGNSLLQSMETAAKNLATKVLDTAVSGLLNAGMNALTGAASGAGSGVALTAGATSAAAVLQAGIAAGVATLVAGATTAAGILTGGGATAAAAVGTGGTVAGGAIVTAGAATDAGLVAAGTTAGTMINGPLVLLMAAIAAAAAVVGLGSNNDAAQKAANDAVMAQVAQTNSSAYDRRLKDGQDASAAQLSMSSDPNSLMGQLQVFDQSAANQRLAEARAGNGAIVELENSLALQREAIIKKSNEAIAKTMNDFLNSIKTGSQSILSPQDQLAYEQNLFNTQLAGAQGGNSDDLNALTTTASALLTLAQNFYASGTGYADTYNKVTSAITGLAAHPTQTIYNDPGITGITSDVTANINSSGGNYTAAGVGYADGGYVGNGIHGIDSVMAKYAGGGNISLAGGEHVTRASSVNSNTRTSLDYINRTGKTPGNDNSEVVRVLTQGFNGQTNAIVSAISEMSSRIASLESTTRQTSNQRRVPGTQKAA
jgi:hypothetical protein